MSNERKPPQKPTGHATIPPALPPDLGRTAPAEEARRSDNPGVEATCAKLEAALGNEEDDAQAIDPPGSAGAEPEPARGRAIVVALVALGVVAAMSGWVATKRPGPKGSSAQVQPKTLNAPAPRPE